MFSPTGFDEIVFVSATDEHLWSAKERAFIIKCCVYFGALVFEELSRPWERAFPLSLSPLQSPLSPHWCGCGQCGHLVARTRISFGALFQTRCAKPKIERLLPLLPDCKIYFFARLARYLVKRIDKKYDEKNLKCHDVQKKNKVKQ